MIRMLLSICLVIASLTAIADSPLTSTPFYLAYKDNKSVIHALENGLDKTTLEYLGSTSTSIVEKIAVINAIGWGNADNVSSFEKYLLQIREGITEDVFNYLRTVSDDAPQENAQTILLTADDLTCWAYMQAMGDYFNPAKGMRAAHLAFRRDDSSMAHAVPYSLIAAQKAFDSSWCRVYQIPHIMLEETVYDKNKISDEALKQIMDYINLYQADCQ